MSTPNMEHVKRIHFIGIGGAGMGGIAEVLLNQGYEVTGSDLNQNRITVRLSKLQVIIADQHHAHNIIGADIVVISTAITEDNPELLAAKKARIPVFSRAQMLAELMRLKYGIAVAGTHGKTTTTSLITSVLAEGGLDPTFVIGGLLKAADTHARLGSSQFFVAEADESDASFLHLYPQISIVTNIDADHLSAYGGDFNRLRAAFLEFLHKLPFNGLAIVCIDDPVIRALLPEIARPTITYGFDISADIQITHFQQIGVQSHFNIGRKGDKPETEITLNLPGQHNVLNAAAAYATAIHLGIGETAIKAAFDQFAGVGRRFQIHGEFENAQRSILLIDDYGHHPREISVTLLAARDAWPDRRLVVAFQPHRYSRTQDLYQDFIEVLSQQPDLLVLLDIYSAGETSIPGISGEQLAEAIRQRGKNTVFVENIDDFSVILDNILQDGDVLIMQGAGNIGALAANLATTAMRLTS